MWRSEISPTLGKPSRWTAVRRWRRACAVVVVTAVAARSDAASRTVRVDGGGVIEAAVSGAPPVTEDAIFRWVAASARGVSAYLGRYPVPQLRLLIRAGGRGRVGDGVTFGGKQPTIRVSVGRATGERDLRDDWVLTHEMTHLAFPDLTSDDAWAEEGLATYVEPLARIRGGTLTEEAMWKDLMEGLPQGLPRRGDRGLHRTQQWGRTYWGGAIFWFLADIELREKTDGRKGLPEALAAILSAGGDIRAHWDLRRTLATADRALGVTVLPRLYDRLGTEPGTVSLDDLWQRLGVRRDNGRISYDDAAPLSAVRRRIGRGQGGTVQR